MKQRDVLDFIDENNLGLVPDCMCSYIYNNSIRLFVGRNCFEIDKNNELNITFSYAYQEPSIRLFIL